MTENKTSPQLKLIETSRELYKKDVDVSRIVDGMVKQGETMKRSAESCAYFSVMWGYSVLEEDEDRILDKVREAYVADKISSIDAWNVHESILNFKSNIVGNTVRALKEKCGCR